MQDETKDLQNKISNLEKKLKEKGVDPKRKKTSKTDKQKKKEEQQKRRLENKLMRVVTKTGISWTAWSSLLEIADDIDGYPLPHNTAAWVYNEHTKKERIIFSTRIMKELPANLLVLVLRHEMLHKAMYRGTKEVSNQSILNMALDAAINKIIWLSNPKQAKKLGDWLVPPESKNRSGVISVLNPGVTTDDFENMNPNIRNIVRSIWWVAREEVDEKSGLTIDKGLSCCDHYKAYKRFGNHTVPDPMVLYNRLCCLLSKEEKQEIKEMYAFLNAGSDDENNHDHARGGQKGLRTNDDFTINGELHIAKETLKSIDNEGSKQDGGRWKRGGGYSAFMDMNAYFEQFIYEVSKAETEGINDFIRQWETLKQVEGICHSIHDTFRKRTVIEPYPNELTRLGQELVTLGVCGPEIPYFFNNSDHDEGSKKKVCCYFDCSPSMNDFIPYMLHITNYIDDCEEAEIAGGQYNGHYIFSEKVKGIPQEKWSEFKEGKIRGGCATSFEAVIKHAMERIENDQVDIIIVFTDGYSGLSQKTIDDFNKSGKKCYNIYFSHGNYNYGHPRYNWGSNAKGVDEDGMYSDLDQLEGKSFTIFCNG